MKIEQEREQILSVAKAKATQSIEDARKEADEIVKKAKLDAELSLKRAIEAVKQSARDIIVALRNEMLDRVKNILRKNSGEAMTPEFMGKIILEIAKSRGDSEDIKLIVGKKDIEQIQALLESSLAKDIKSKPQILSISSSADIVSGLKIGFKGDDVFLDFSDEALSDMICAYVGPRIVAILKESKE
jgi:vacuolar-type H+-ATPase subunit E/Vma4